jgi:hypothetical protein
VQQSDTDEPVLGVGHRERDPVLVDPRTRHPHTAVPDLLDHAPTLEARTDHGTGPPRCRSESCRRVGCGYMAA